MRPPVPQLDSTLSKEKFLELIVNNFQSVVFATVDQEGNPHSNVADIEMLRDRKLFFSTTYQKPFYQHLCHHPRISITALRGQETMSSVGLTLDGFAKEVDLKYLDMIFAKHPEMKTITTENQSERHNLLRPFAIIPISGSVYDLREHPIFQKHFKFDRF